MKLSVLLLLAISAALSTVSAAQAWVDGVSQSTGWYDANKVSPYTADGDNNLCWAASASNLIAWWQDKYQVPAGVPNDINNIWATYKNAATEDIGGDTHAAVQWWLTGVYIPTNDEEADRSIFAQEKPPCCPHLKDIITRITEKKWSHGPTMSSGNGSTRWRISSVLIIEPP